MLPSCHLKSSTDFLPSTTAAHASNGFPVYPGTHTHV